MKKLGIFFCMMLFLVCGCGKETQDKQDRLDQILSENNYVIVDVRTKEEYETGHVVDALNLPYDEIDETVSLDKTKTILVYCRSGKRSSIAYQTLKELGYEVFDLGAYDALTFEKES